MAAERSLYAKEDRRHRAGEGVDIPFLCLVLGLLAVGLVMLYSASSAQSMYDTGYAISTKYLQKQAVCAALGLVCMGFFSRIPANFWHKYAWWLYGGSIALLLSVLVFGESVNGARRWISIAGIQFQPSELAKFTMILLFARLTRGFGPKAGLFRYGVMGFGLALMGILVPLALEKHLSAIMLMGMVAVVMMYWHSTASQPASRVVRASASDWPRKSAHNWSTCFTSLTSQASDCTSVTTNDSSARSSNCATSAIR